MHTAAASKIDLLMAEPRRSSITALPFLPFHLSLASVYASAAIVYQTFRDAIHRLRYTLHSESRSLAAQFTRWGFCGQVPHGGLFQIRAQLPNGLLRREPQLYILILAFLLG